MTIYTSPALVVAPDFDYQPHHPLVLWDTLVTRSNIVVSSELDAYPGTNLANPNTNLRWEGASAGVQVITLSDLNGETDCLSIARHNLGSDAIEVTSIEGITAEPGAVWTAIFGPQVLPDDAPAMFRFAKNFYTGIRMTLTPTTTAPQCAILFCGELMAMRPGITPGMVPVTRALAVDLFNGRSERGEYLGAIIAGAELGSSFQIRDIDADFYAEVLKPFVLAANQGAPFFFVWSPEGFPDEVAYAWLRTSALPSVSRSTGQLDMSFDIGALAL